MMYSKMQIIDAQNYRSRTISKIIVTSRPTIKIIASTRLRKEYVAPIEGIFRDFIVAREEWHSAYE